MDWVCYSLAQLAEKNCCSAISHVWFVIGRSLVYHQFTVKLYKSHKLHFCASQDTLIIKLCAQKSQ